METNSIDERVHWIAAFADDLRYGDDALFGGFSG
jgi:hypothetical protein